MKLADLPQPVLGDLCDEDKWRLDIDPGLDAKHEFYLSWNSFLVLSASPYFEQTEADLADFINFDGYDVLLPVERSHHPKIELVRLIPSADQQTLTLFLHDSYHEDYFSDGWAARYGFLAVADRYSNHGSSFYLANYYHFSYLVGADYEKGQEIMARKSRD